MSLRALTTVWNESKASGTLLLLELAIADTANEKGWAWPGIDFLAHKARMSRRTIISLLQELEELEELMIERNAGPRGTNRYLLLLVSKGRITSPDDDEGGAKVARVQKLHGANGDTQIAPEPSGTGTPPPNSIGEWPDEEEVIAFAKAYPGSLAIGIPAGMTPRWAQDYFDYNTFNSGRWPANWQEDMKRRYQKDWQSGHPKARGDVKQNSSMQPASPNHKKNGRRERGEILQELEHAKKAGADTTALKKELQENE